MSEIETVVVPFVAIGDRRGIYHKDVVERDEVRAFVNAFAHCFERIHQPDAWLLIEPQEAGSE